MPPITRITAAALATALLLPVPGVAMAREVPEPPEHTRVTLITGDRVLVSSRPGAADQVVFEPGPGSTSTSAVITRSGGHTLVVPSAAVPQVVAGSIDRALFDITTLISEGRDDAHSTGVPVIVEYDGTPATALTQAVRSVLPGTAGRVLASVGARAGVIDKSAAGSFWQGLGGQDGIRRISLDRRVRVALDRSVAQIGAPSAWRSGFTGKGVKVAVLDTGIDTGHPDLTGRVVASRNFSDASTTQDHAGHGTHVAGILAGSGVASGGKYRGVAPEVTLLNGKVLDDDGAGSTSGIIAGMEWAAASGAKVVNLSLTDSAPSDGSDLLSQAVNRLTRRTGMLFVVAAGNCFDAEPQQTPSPAAADEAVAVGNLQADGTPNGTSCRGLRTGDGAVKPEISAPGTGIVAARAAGTSAGDPVSDHYTAYTGTSMAAPHVTGTVALIAQANPGWRAPQLKARLLSTANPQHGSAIRDQGAGRVDAAQAVSRGIGVDIGELELGMLRKPHPVSDLVRRTLVYRNPAAVPVTLNLTVTGTAPEHAPRLSKAALVVPPRGQVAVQVAVDRRKAGAGSHTGRIVARPAAGGQPLVTTFGWSAEP